MVTFPLPGSALMIMGDNDEQLLKPSSLLVWGVDPASPHKNPSPTAMLVRVDPGPLIESQFPIPETLRRYSCPLAFTPQISSEPTAILVRLFGFETETQLMLEVRV
jgi:hypothetical protein